jgi:L-asparaginase II
MVLKAGILVGKEDMIFPNLNFINNSNRILTLTNTVSTTNQQFSYHLSTILKRLISTKCSFMLYNVYSIFYELIIMQNPILVEVIRNGVVESKHSGSAVVVNTDGEVVYAIGDYQRHIYPRSAIKPLQAIPLLESGAAEHFDLSDKEIALACASHNSEDIHVNAVKQWLNKLELNVDSLECGAALPSYRAAAHHMIANGVKASKAHHNCSGKHCGMLTIASHLLPQVGGYSAHSHIVQQIWMNTLSELIDEDVSKMHWEQDGCGLPAIYMPMLKLAQAFSRFADTEKQPGARGSSMKKILSSLAQYPEMIAGSERCCTAVIKETKAKVIVKTGAEAVFAGVIPHLKLGFALKIDDGATRASEVALGALLSKVSAIDEQEKQRLNVFFEPKIVNSVNHQTGIIKASNAW